MCKLLLVVIAAATYQGIQADDVVTQPMRELDPFNLKLYDAEQKTGDYIQATSTASEDMFIDARGRHYYPCDISEGYYDLSYLGDDFSVAVDEESRNFVLSPILKNGWYIEGSKTRGYRLTSTSLGQLKCIFVSTTTSMFVEDKKDRTLEYHLGAQTSSTLGSPFAPYLTEFEEQAQRLRFWCRRKTGWERSVLIQLEDSNQWLAADGQQLPPAIHFSSTPKEYFGFKLKADKMKITEKRRSVRGSSA